MFSSFADAIDELELNMSNTSANDFACSNSANKLVDAESVLHRPCLTV